MKKANEYIKCPRCELNYILKKDKYCDVCKSEMRAGSLEEVDNEDLDEDLELCPICKVNYINEGESMCSTCREERVEGVRKDDEPDWRGYVDKGDEEDEDMDLLPVEEDDEIDEELEGAFAKDLEDEEFEEDEEDEEFDGEDEEDDFKESFKQGNLDFEEDEEDEEENEEDDDLID